MEASALREIANRVDDRERLDIVYKEILYPMLEKYAERTKSTEMRITDNQYERKITDKLIALYPKGSRPTNPYGVPTLQDLIETDMKPYLESKGFNVIIWSPKYSVEIAW